MELTMYILPCYPYACGVEKSAMAHFLPLEQVGSALNTLDQ